jgi:hypothetical protein
VGLEGFFFLLGVVSVLAVLAGLRAQRAVQAYGRSELFKSWERYAQRHGFVLEAEPAYGVRPSLPQLASAGQLEAVRAVYTQTGTDTCVSRKPAISVLGTLVATTERRSAGQSESNMLTGDAAFDDAFVVTCKPGFLAERLLDREARRLLLGFRMGGAVVLEYERAKLSLTWRGGETNHARLDEGRRLLAHLASRLEQPAEARAAAVAG